MRKIFNLKSSIHKYSMNSISSHFWYTSHSKPESIAFRLTWSNFRFTKRSPSSPLTPKVLFVYKQTPTWISWKLPAISSLRWKCGWTRFLTSFPLKKLTSMKLHAMSLSSRKTRYWSNSNPEPAFCQQNQPFPWSSSKRNFSKNPDKKTSVSVSKPTPVPTPSRTSSPISSPKWLYSSKLKESTIYCRDCLNSRTNFRSKTMRNSWKSLTKGRQ